MYKISYNYISKNDSVLITYKTQFMRNYLSKYNVRTHLPRRVFENIKYNGTHDISRVKGNA